MVKDNQMIELFNNMRKIPAADRQEKFLIVTLGDHRYSLETRLITEIVSITRMSQETDMSTCVKGVLNSQGHSIPVLDIRAWFGSPARQYDDRTNIVVMKMDGEHFGLVVDRINKITTLWDAQLLSVPAT